MNMEPRFDRAQARPGEVSREFARALSSGELDQAAAMFAEQAIFKTGDGALLRGRAVVREVLIGLIESRVRMEVSIASVIETDGVAVASETWTMSMVSPGGVPEEISGRSTVVFGRGAEGWEIAIDAPWGL